MSAPEAHLHQQDKTDEQPVRTANSNAISESRPDIDPDYEVVAETPDVDTATLVVDPWAEKQYPLNRDSDLPEGVIQTNPRWRAVQHPDGSGVVESGRGTATYAVRTADETIVSNSVQDLMWPYRSKYDGDRDDCIEIPYNFVAEVLMDQTDLEIGSEDSLRRIGSDSDTFVDGSEFMRSVVSADILEDSDEEGVLLTHATGMQVYVGRDSTSHDSFELFGFVPFDGTSGVRAPSARDALDLLTPMEAAASADSMVERQGEWFLVPTEREAEGTIQKPGVAQKPYGGSPLDNHVPRDWRPIVGDRVFVERFQREFADRLDTEGVETPQDCLDRLYESGIATEQNLVYDTVRELAGGVQVRGSLRHRNNEHLMASVDEWRSATTHDQRVLTQDGTEYIVE